jgi:CubicO group peptidase (beta-lactamase class C family)
VDDQKGESMNNRKKSWVDGVRALKSRVSAPSRLRHSLTALATAVVVGNTAAVAAMPSQSIPAALFEGHSIAKTRARIDSAFKELAGAQLFAGAVLIAKDDKILFEGAYGLASREYGVFNTVNTELNLASAGKMFTTVSIGRLVDQGRVSFEDPIGKYLDASWIDAAAGQQIKIANLLDHTSGVPDYFGPEFLDKSRVLFKELDDYKPLIANLKPTFVPGTQWSYSNTNFLLLGAIIEKVTGESYDDYVRQAVFEPAGMTHSGALDLEKVNHDYAQGYAKFPPPPPPPGGRAQRQDFRQTAIDMAAGQKLLAKAGFEWRNNVFMHVAKGESSGGTFSSAPDLLKFANALTSGRLIKPATLAFMASSKPGSPDYGYGFQLIDGGFGHTGGFPGISTAVVIYPNGYRLIVLSNVDGGSAVADAKLLELGGVPER